MLNTSYLAECIFCNEFKSWALRCGMKRHVCYDCLREYQEIDRLARESRNFYELVTRLVGAGYRKAPAPVAPRGGDAGGGAPTGRRGAGAASYS